MTTQCKNSLHGAGHSTTIREYYAESAVRDRIAQYCGGHQIDPESFTAEYLSGVSEDQQIDRYTEEYFLSTSRSSFFWLLEQDMDIFRAVWDRNATLGILDVEYYNLVYPGEAYFKPREVFSTLEPLYESILRVFSSFGFRVLPIMTGQGYHFVFQVGFASPVHRKLAALGPLNPILEQKYHYPQGMRCRPVPQNVGLAFEGMGRLMEYLAHLIITDLGKKYRGIPVMCTDVSVGQAREAIALDLSMYGDPLHTRDVRCPFSTYQKHRVLKDKFGDRASQEIATLVTLPRTPDMSLSKMLHLRHDFDACCRFARHTETAIPESSAGVNALIRSYRASKLFRFHHFFDSAQHDSPDAWPSTYDRLELEKLPPCVAHCLAQPNDHLLKPTNLQTLTRVLLKMGWHPKHIAGLVRSKFERDYGWGNQWERYDASTRADFYVRLFAGLLDTGLDREEDLNCFSHAEKGYCLTPGCGWNLVDFK